MKKYTEQEVKIIGSTIKDLREAVKLIDDGADLITYLNRFQQDLLDTDRGHIQVRVDEVVQDIKQLIKDLKKIYFSSAYDDYDLE